MSHKWFRICAILVSLVTSVAAFLRLPAHVPEDWWIPGDSDEWLVRTLLAFFLPAAAVTIVLLFRRLASIDPLRENYQRFSGAYELVLTSAVLFVIGLHGVLLGTLLGAPAWIWKLPSLMVGVILIVVGNVVPRIRPNVALGVRTPWTLGDEGVWASTHRVAGYVLVACGAVVLLEAVIAPHWLRTTLEVGAGAAVAALVAFSYALWRSKKASHSRPGEPRVTPSPQRTEKE